MSRCGNKISVGSRACIYLLGPRLSNLALERLLKRDARLQSLGVSREQVLRSALLRGAKAVTLAPVRRPCELAAMNGT